MGTLFDDRAAQDVIENPFVEITVDLRHAFGDQLRALRTLTTPEIVRTLRSIARARTSGYGTFYRWIIPYGITTLDPRLFRAVRENQPLGPRVPVVLHCAGPTDEAGWGLGLDAFHYFDELAWSAERLWEIEWMDSPPQDRPGLVLSRPDGVVVLSSGLAPRLRDALMGLSIRQIVRADLLKECASYRHFDEPTSSDVSRALAMLASQGLLAAPEEPLPPWARVRPRGNRRPYRAYVSVAYAAQRRRHGIVEDEAELPDHLEHLTWIGHSPGQRERLEAARWERLVDRLREFGLRSV